MIKFRYAHYQLRTEVPPKIQWLIWELILMHQPSTKMLAQYWVEVLSTALNSLVAGLTSLKIWSTKSAKTRHLCASISAHSLHCENSTKCEKTSTSFGISSPSKVEDFFLILCLSYNYKWNLIFPLKYKVTSSTHVSEFILPPWRPSRPQTCNIWEYVSDI